MIMLTFLEGKKSYAVAVITIVYALSGFFLGYVDAQTAFTLILGASGLASLRAGITNG